jgi:pimeloyl-ACP methyl ester carboxylesterase
MTRPMPHVEGVEHRHVDAAGLRMHVAEAGEGEPLVLLHGWPQHWYCWRRLIPELARRHRVICPDLRGFGWTDAPPSGYEKTQLAADVATLLEVLELDQVRLIGHDWGGVTGYILSVERPELVSRFMALNTGHLWGKTDLRSMAQLWRFWYAAAMALPLAGAAFTRALPEIFERTNALGSDQGVWSARELEYFSAQFREPERRRASELVYRTFLTTELLESARGRWNDARLRVPTLHLHGLDDGAIHPAVLRGWEDHADDMRLELVPGCGHFIAEQCPEIVLEHAREFFA